MTLTRRRLRWWILGLMAALLLFLIAVGTGLGSVSVPLGDTAAVLLAKLGFPVGGFDPKWEAIIVLVRLPRVLGAALIGAALAVSGAVMQGLLRNPMADPGIIGVSAGGGFGAVLAIAFGLTVQGPWFLPLFASIGSLTATGIIFLLSIRRGTMGLFTLLLAGLAVGTFFAAGTSMVLTFASRDNVAQFIFWAMGNLSGLRWESLSLVVAPIAIGLALLTLFGRELNVLLLGEEEARSLGVNVFVVRVALLVLVSVTTASAVCIGGPIGFIGLIVPHTLRLLLGPDHRLLLPASALGGACFMVGCDLVARLAVSNQEINVGIVTSLLGAPYFLFVLRRSAKRDRES